jgi:hypothetical protein
MALFRAVKNFLSPVELEIDGPLSFSRHTEEIAGHIKLTARGPQQVDDVVIILVEKTRRNNTEYEDIRGQAQVCSRPFTIEDGETITLPFSMGIRIPKRGWERLIDDGGVIGALGRVASFLDDSDDHTPRSDYELVAAADVLGCKFDPRCTRHIGRFDGFF